MSNVFDGVSRWYWNVVYNINKYRSLLLTVIFGFFAIVSLQYWQQISQPITRGYSETTIGEIQVRMWAPDKLYIDEKYQELATQCQDEANKAIEMFNGKDLGGRALTVNEARPREERPRGDFGGAAHARNVGKRAL